MVYLGKNSQVSVGELEPGCREQMVSYQRAIIVHELDSSASPSSRRPRVMAGASPVFPACHCRSSPVAGEIYFYSLLTLTLQTFSQQAEGVIK